MEFIISAVSNKDQMYAHTPSVRENPHRSFNKHKHMSINQQEHLFQNWEHKLVLTFIHYLISVQMYLKSYILLSLAKIQNVNSVTRDSPWGRAARPCTWLPTRRLRVSRDRGAWPPPPVSPQTCWQWTGAPADPEATNTLHRMSEQSGD
jgi:hypothetical protein